MKKELKQKLIQYYKLAPTDSLSSLDTMYKAEKQLYRSRFAWNDYWMVLQCICGGADMIHATAKEKLKALIEVMKRIPNASHRPSSY